MSRIWLMFLPELGQFPENRQAKALQKARDCALESSELIGIAIWLILVTSLSKFILTKAGFSTDPSMTLAMNIVLVVPLLAAVFIPIHVRRLRRGLRKQLGQQGKS